jgi:hypothetical protein
MDDRDGVTLDRYEWGERLDLEFTVTAESEHEARTKVFTWLEEFSTNGTWIDEAGLTIDLDSEEPEADFTDINDMFSINGFQAHEDDA